MRLVDVEVDMQLTDRWRWACGPRVAAALVVALLAASSGGGGAWAADEPPAGAGRPQPGATGEGEATADEAVEPTLAVIRGRSVNVRVGPRVDRRPVTQLDDGAVLIVVERVPGWVGVQIPAGFPAAVSAQYVTPAGADAVRVQARRLNLRAHPPVEGEPMPGAFRDYAVDGMLLPLVRREGDWVWVLAPETVRAYVSADYVRELGPPAQNAELLARARRAREERVERMRAERREQAALASGKRLREAIGTAQQALYRLRLEGGWERTPVVEAATALEAVIAASRTAPAAIRKLAHALRQDLESELELRLARKDAEVARLRGLDPPTAPPGEPKRDAIVVRGVIRWEPAPTWRNGGAFVLWVEDEPTHVLRLTTGMPLPMPDLRGNADGGPRTIHGRLPGDRVFGLPVIEVRSIGR